MSEETAFEFPCQFPIKAMGKNTPEFETKDNQPRNIKK